MANLLLALCSRRRALGGIALAILALASPGCSPAAEAPAVRPTNLLLLIADDLSRADLGSYGNRDCATPGIDLLASEGLRFHRAYAPAPICQPSRACLYTGRYPQGCGANGADPIRETVPTWAELLEPETCCSGLIGKLSKGQLERYPFEFLARPDADQPGGWDGGRVEAAFETFLQQSAGRRFCLVVSLQDPHRPFPDRASIADPHDPEALSPGPLLVDTPLTRAELAGYYDAVARLDGCVGRLLALLDRRGHRNDTLVVFTSDNGSPFPFAKTTLYEAGINLPFIVRWPGVVAPGGESDEMVSLLDLLPTALDTFGTAAPAELEGRSLLPLLRGEQAGLRDHLFASHTFQARDRRFPSRAIRTERFKYIRNFFGGRSFRGVSIDGPLWLSWLEAAGEDPALRSRLQQLIHRPDEELFDLEADPFELTNLAGDAGSRQTLVDLRARLRGWMESQEDALLESWPR